MRKPARDRSACVAAAPGRIVRSAAAVAAAALASAGCVSPDAGAPDGAAAPSTAGAETAPGSAHGSFADFTETHFSSQAWRDDVARDYIETSDVLVPVGLAAGAAAVAPWDHSLASRSADHRWSTGPGNLALGTLVVGSFALGALAPGEGRSAGDEIWTQAEAQLTTAGAVEISKRVVGRDRPFSDTSGSFPSGEAAAAFAAATLIDRNSGHALGYPAYGIAVLEAFARVRRGSHFPSDVLAGAALGAFDAGVIDALHFGTGRGGHGISGRGPDVSVGLEVDPGGGVLGALTIRF
jgi:PAP2 superfamily protein